MLSHADPAQENEDKPPTAAHREHSLGMTQGQQATGPPMPGEAAAGHQQGRLARAEEGQDLEPRPHAPRLDEVEPARGVTAPAAPPAPHHAVARKVQVRTSTL